VTAPKAATTQASGKRWYDWRGERYWSVTTIIDGGIPKRALINWAANETAAFACDNLQDLVPLLERGERDAVYDMLKRSPWRKTKKAADLGTALHEAIEAYVLGKPFPPWDPEVKPRMESFERFLADWEPEYEMTEASVFNRTERYAGTLDAIITGGKLGTRRILNDVKSGKGVYAETALQMAAYRHAEFIGIPDGSERPMPDIDGAAVLHLPEAGGYELVDVRADQEVFQAFLYCREVFRWVEQTAKTVILGPLVSLDAVPEQGQQAALDLAKAMA
jgi:hypothetical protein